LDRFDRGGDFGCEVKKKIVWVQVKGGKVGSFGDTFPGVEMCVWNCFEDTVDGVGYLKFPLGIVIVKVSEVDWSPADRNAKNAIVDVNIVDSWLCRILGMSQI
jgi:hypothetical protein